MSNDAQSARDDLAFLRAIAGGDEAVQMRTFGETYFAAGLIYGGQMLLHAAQAVGWIGQGEVAGLAIGLGPTILFIPVLAVILWRNRANRLSGAVSRAVGAVFGAVGLANLVLIVIIGGVALHEHSLQTWLIYPCCVFVLQGTAWLFAFMMRRKGWFAAVAAGWFASAIAMAFCVFALNWFILFAGLGLWACMALPGLIMLRTPRTAG
jgi:hypothetical protein